MSFGTLMKCPLTSVPDPGSDVVVVPHARRVGHEGPEVSLVGQQRVRARCDVGVELRLSRRELHGRVERIREGPARERVVAREHDRVSISGDRDAVLVVVPAHPVDRLVLAGLDVERDDKSGLLLRRVPRGRRPGRLLPVDVVRRLFVREEDLPVEPLLLRREVVGAETLVAGAARDGERAVEHPGRTPVEDQPAHLRVVEVVLPVGRRGRRPRCTGTAPCWSRGSRTGRLCP